jgi:hypothetical protein
MRLEHDRRRQPDFTERLDRFKRKLESLEVVCTAKYQRILRPREGQRAVWSAFAQFATESPLAEPTVARVPRVQRPLARRAVQ